MLCSGRRRNLHADAGDVFCYPLQYAPGQVRHILDDHLRTRHAAERLRTGLYLWHRGAQPHLGMHIRI